MPAPARPSAPCTRLPGAKDCTQQWVRLPRPAAGHGRADAADCLEQDQDDFITFYDFARGHSTHLRTSKEVTSLARMHARPEETNTDDLRSDGHRHGPVADLSLRRWG